MLTQERLKELYEYNPGTGEFIRRVDITPTYRAGQVAGTLRKGYIVIGVDKTIYYAHRLAFLYCHGKWPANDIDHINGKRSDNRLVNLREATRAQNLQNLKKARSNSKTGLLGVSPHKATGKYQSKIVIKGHTTYIGTFDTAEEASTAYLAVKRGLHSFSTL